MNNWQIPEIDVYELRRRLQQGDGGALPFLLDVREPDEWRIARLPGAVLAPLSDLAQRGRAALPAQLQPETQLVVYCHHGVRSVQAVAWLLRQGFHNAVSLAGGIDAWSAQIDPEIPRYY